MSDSAQMAHARLVSNAWNDQSAMDDLTSGDQARIKAQCQKAGLHVPDGVTVHVHQHSDDAVHLVLPKKEGSDIRNLQSGAGGGHKCYGPFCLCGPY